jgi:hypothetical protein
LEKLAFAFVPFKVLLENKFFKSRQRAGRIVINTENNDAII